ncbi:MAG TPA: DUF459 domain-containing protein [Gaiellaceae bacterium]|nr:DUF459 domain-containing protein [Gaiellaceae bacterium]
MDAPTRIRPTAPRTRARHPGAAADSRLAGGSAAGPRRRLHPAGHAVVVGVGALVLGAFLNAPGLHKTAETLQPGWKRDVALPLTEALDSVSHALLLDRPRNAVKAALGRSDDDRIVTQITLPPPAAVPPPPVGAPPPVRPPAGKAATSPGQRTPAQRRTPPAQPRKQAFSPSHPLRIYVGGDSLVIVPGYSLLRALGGSKVYKPVGPLDGHVATGLERPDVYNWFDRIRQVMKDDHPNVVVVAFGANDDHDYMTGLPPGTSVGSFGSASWVKEYRRRVAGIMDTVIRAHGFLVWIGLPIARSASETRDFEVINRIVAEEARKRPRGAAYVDTYLLFADPNTGGYAEYLPKPDGELVKVRAPDGVHFETAGGDIIARLLLKELNAQFDLTSWRRHAS